MSLFEDMTRLAGEMRAAHDSRSAEVEALRAATAQNRNSMRAQHQAMAEAQRHELDQFAVALRENTAGLLRSFEADRSMMSADQHRRLEDFTHELQQRTTERLRTHAAERRAMGTSQQQHLSEYREQVRARTAAFVAEAHATRLAHHNDHAAAQRSWQQFNAEMRQRRTQPRRTGTTE